MSTSDIKTLSMPSKSCFKTSFVYLILTLFVALFGAVYELFSHEVYSYYMIYAFTFPLIGGVMPFLATGLFRPTLYPGSVARNLYHSGIATLTVGSLLQGVLEIYGTTNSLTVVHWMVGGVLMVVGIIIWLTQPIIRKL